MTPLRRAVLANQGTGQRSFVCWRGVNWWWACGCRYDVSVTDKRFAAADPTASGTAEGARPGSGECWPAVFAQH